MKIEELAKEPKFVQWDSYKERFVKIENKHFLDKFRHRSTEEFTIQDNILLQGVRYRKRKW